MCGLTTKSVPHQKSFCTAVFARIHHKSFDGDKYSVAETKLLWKRFDNLRPNTQYVFYLVAVSELNNETSQSSEKIVVWTDPAVPPIVDVSTITTTYVAIISECRVYHSRYVYWLLSFFSQWKFSHRQYIQTTSSPKVLRWPCCVWRWAIPHQKSHYSWVVLKSEVIPHDKWLPLSKMWLPKWTMSLAMQVCLSPRHHHPGNWISI